MRRFAPHRESDAADCIKQAFDRDRRAEGERRMHETERDPRLDADGEPGRKVKKKAEPDGPGFRPIRQHRLRRLPHPTAHHSGVDLHRAEQCSIHALQRFRTPKHGTGLQDQISQGSADGQEFRTAPLWGVGQRIFFLHDGRMNNIVTAVQAHASSGSEANQVINNFNKLSPSDQQAVIAFLRSLLRLVGGAAVG